MYFKNAIPQQNIKEADLCEMQKTRTKDAPPFVQVRYLYTQIFIFQEKNALKTAKSYLETSFTISEPQSAEIFSKVAFMCRKRR